jgi:hypothetical protein
MMSYVEYISRRPGLQTAVQTSMAGDPHAAEHLPILPRW